MFCSGGSWLWRQRERIPGTRVTSSRRTAVILAVILRRWTPTKWQALGMVQPFIWQSILAWDRRFSRFLDITFSKQTNKQTNKVLFYFLDWCRLIVFIPIYFVFAYFWVTLQCVQAMPFIVSLKAVLCFSCNWVLNCYDYKKNICAGMWW